MRRNWLIGIVVLILFVALYLIEMSKVKTGSINNNMPRLDNMIPDSVARTWDLFYKVRATIIDGQSATFSIPSALREKEGKTLRLTGAVVFRGNGCELIDSNTTRINYFFLLPTHGLARACELQPDEAMRWTIRVNLAEPWVLSRTLMIGAEAIVSGTFKIDTSLPYEAAFLMEEASAELKPEND
jgi:hypothetical protein